MLTRSNHVYMPVKDRFTVVDVFILELEIKSHLEGDAKPVHLLYFCKMFVITTLTAHCITEKSPIAQK